QSFFQKIDKAVYDSLSRAYTSYISNSVSLNKDYDGFLKTSHQLYRLLFQNIILPPGGIIISPDGRYFPFEALVTDIKTGKYFLNDYAVSYTYSARYLLNEFTRTASSTSNDFFGIAPVNYSNGQAALVGSDESLYRMQNYFGKATNLVLGKASKNNFLNGFSNY